MTGLEGADRREYRRYQTSIEVELVTETEIVPCTLVDISLTGASVSCGRIAENAAVKLRLAGFGEINVFRLRAAKGVERLLFKNTDHNIQRVIYFLTTLVDTGGASPALHRRWQEPARAYTRRGNCTLNANDSLTLRVDQAIALVQQMLALGGDLPENVLLFPSRTSVTHPAGPSPDNVA